MGRPATHQSGAAVQPHRAARDADPFNRDRPRRHQAGARRLPWRCLYEARVCFKWRDTIGRAAAEPVPAGVDYDLWTGPAPMQPFTKNRFHYNWHWNFTY